MCCSSSYQALATLLWHFYSNTATSTMRGKQEAGSLHSLKDIFLIKEYYFLCMDKALVTQPLRRFNSTYLMQ